MNPIMNIMDTIVNNGTLFLGGVATVAILIYSIVGMTGRRGQSTFKEGVMWVAIALAFGLAAKELSAWFISVFGG